MDRARQSIVDPGFETTRQVILSWVYIEVMRDFLIPVHPPVHLSGNIPAAMFGAADLMSKETMNNHDFHTFLQFRQGVA